MNENIKRAISDIIYITVMWIGTSYSATTFSLLFAILGTLSIYEMWKLRQGKKKLFAFLYISIPFLLIPLLIIRETNYLNNMFDPSLVLLILILTWTFDTFAYLFGIKFGKHKIMPSISPYSSTIKPTLVFADWKLNSCFDREVFSGTKRGSCSAFLRALVGKSFLP